MSTNTLLERIQGVRAAGPGRWMARCPAHQDRNPSLSIRESDGRVLVHCFAGCEVYDVLCAVGLTLADLFDRPLTHHRASAQDRRHSHGAGAALKLLAHESLVVLVAAENLAAGRPLTDDDRARVVQAAVTVRRAREAAT